MADSSDALPGDANGSAVVQSEPSLNENVSVLDDINSYSGVTLNSHMTESSDVLPGDANGTAVVHSESSPNESVAFLDDIDSWLDEVNAGLHISRFVIDVVLKGTVRDVEREVARQIASKDSEITLLNQKLQQHGNGGLSLPEGRDKRYDEFYWLRQQLDSISKSLLNSEWGISVSQHNSEGSEDVSKQRSKEQSSRDGTAEEHGSKSSEEEVFNDPTLLNHMEKDQLIAYFNKEMNQMKRQHDSAVQEKTEEIFKLKRRLLRNEGPNPWHLRNNKELEQTRRKIGEVITKLDVLLMENKRSTVRIKSDAFPGHHEKNNVLDSDIQRLQNGTSNDDEAHCSIPTQTSHFSSIEADHENHIMRLQSDIEDASVAATIREEVEKIVLEEFISEIKIRLHGHERELDMKQEVCSIIQNEAVSQAMSNIHSLLLKHNEDKVRAEEESLQKQKFGKLKRMVDSFTEVVREKEDFVSQIGLEVMVAQVDSLCRQLDFLRDKVEKQDSYISEKSREFDTIVDRLEQAQRHVQHNNVIVGELNDRFRSISDSLKQLEEQNQVLRAVIEEKEKILSSTLSKDIRFEGFMNHVIESMRKFEKCITDQQTIVGNKVQDTESRFCLLTEQCKHLAKEGNLLRKKALRYKEISETRGSNLQKAELEVDLLGDEVETLTDLLAKIYIALDHYSPVLQHYTGVMETLNMIKKHISIAK